MATLLTNAGRAIKTGLISGVTAALPKYLGVGTGAGTTAATDTTLFTEATTGTWAGYARVVCTLSQKTTSVTNDTWQAVGTLTAPSAQALTNAGWFDAATVGDLFLKGDFAVVNLATNDNIQVTGTLQEL